MFIQILPSPFRKRIRKRQRKGSGHITAKQNFIHKEMFSKSFLRQQRQQWQREERAQRKMSRSDIQQGQQNYCCPLDFFANSRNHLVNLSTEQEPTSQFVNPSTFRKRSTWIIWERLLPKLCVCLSRLRNYPCVSYNKNIPTFGLFWLAVTFYRFCHHIIFFFRHLIGFYPPVFKV